MKTVNYLSKSPSQTEKIGWNLAQKILKGEREGVVISLKGEMGG